MPNVKGRKKTDLTSSSDLDVSRTKKEEGEEKMITYAPNGDEYLLGIPSVFIGQLLVLAGSLTLLAIGAIQVFNLSYEGVKPEYYAIPGIVILGGVIFWRIAHRQQNR